MKANRGLMALGIMIAAMAGSVTAFADTPLFPQAQVVGEHENYRNLYDAVRPFEYVIYAIVIVGGAYLLYRWLRGRGESVAAG